jgi:hypothetical protein
MNERNKSPRSESGAAQLTQQERQYVTTIDGKQKAADYVKRLQEINPTYWTPDQIIETLYAHRENMKADVESALRPEWKYASAQVAESGNSGWGMVVRAAVEHLRAQLTDAQQARDLWKVAAEKEVAAGKAAEATLASLRQLITGWRERGDNLQENATFADANLVTSHGEVGIALHRCADELDAALAGAGPTTTREP